MPPLWATSWFIQLRDTATAIGRPLTMLEAPQCSFGRGPNGLFLKRTAFLCTPATAKRLAGFNALQCRHEHHEHDTIVGRDEQGQIRSARSAAYPQQLCDCLVYGLSGNGDKPEPLASTEAEDGTQQAPRRTANGAVKRAAALADAFLAAMAGQTEASSGAGLSLIHI